MFTSGLQTKAESPNYNEPFYIEDLSGTSNTVSIVKGGNTAYAPTVTVEYSTDNIIWYTMGTTSSTAITATVPANGKLYLRATTTAWGAYNTSAVTYGYNTISCSDNFQIGGCLSSLLFGSNYINNVNSFPTGSTYTFYKLFYQSYKLIHAKDAIFPRTTVRNCYENMFGYCSNLISAPNLMAGEVTTGAYKSMFYHCTKLTDLTVFTVNSVGTEGCYGMFMGCTSLVTSPVINVQYTMKHSFESMFQGCTALVTAPLLPALLIDDYCYQSMFSGCTSLLNVPDLPASVVYSDSYRGMFNGCTSLTTPPVIGATTVRNNGCYEMFKGCTSLTTAPALPATSISESAYSSMFYYCTSLTTAPALPATTLANNCYSSMFYLCTSLTTAPALPATTLAPGCYSSMFYQCISLTTAPALPSTALADYCYQNMFCYCTALKTAPVLPATTLANNCYYGMFEGCSKLDQAPVLPASTLVQGCYQNMFNGCSILRYIKCLATSGFNASNALTYWTASVWSEGVFTKADNVTDWPTNSNSGIPSGWTVYDASSEPDPVPIPTIQKSYFYIENRDNSANTITITRTGADFPSSYIVYESTDEENWTPLTTGSRTITTTIPASSKKYFKHSGTFSVNDEYKPTTISSSGYINIGGNLLSMEYGDDFVDGKVKTYGNNYTYFKMFYGNTKLVDASNFILTDTSGGGYGYASMFSGCTALTSIGKLPQAISDRAFQGMFEGCSSLVNVPDIEISENSVGLNNRAYNNTFMNCTSLESIVLKGNPAYRGSYVFANMFFGCSKLKSVTCLLASPRSSQMQNWLGNVSATGTFTKNPSATWDSGMSGIPEGWTVIDYSA